MMSKRFLYILSIVATLRLLSLPCKGQTARFFSADDFLTNSLTSCLLQDSRGFVWVGSLFVGTEGNGMFVLQPSSSAEADGFAPEALAYTPKSYWNCPVGLQMDEQKVWSITEDRDGNLWMAFFQKGLLMQPFRNSGFETVGHHSSVDNPIGSHCVMSVEPGLNGELWIGTDNDGIKCLGESDFSVEFLASEVALSRSQLHRRMKAMTGQSVIDFIRGMRLKHAAQLLENGHQNISEVAYACGFETPSSFSTAFKRYYGVAPSEFVKK